jgi:hypothetical protein
MSLRQYGFWWKKNELDMIVERGFLIIYMSTDRKNSNNGCPMVFCQNKSRSGCVISERCLPVSASI